MSYNFTICHEGYHPFKDKLNWPENFSDDQENFSPAIGGVITRYQLRKFEFTLEDASELGVSAPDLVIVDSPEFKEEKSMSEKYYDSKIAIEPLRSIGVPTLTPTHSSQNAVDAPTPVSGQNITTSTVNNSRVHNFWKSILAEKTEGSRGENLPANYPVMPVTSLVLMLDPRAPRPSLFAPYLL